MQNNPIITLKNIFKSFYLDDWTEIPVLKGIDLEIFTWEFITLMWESWSWKSTLLNIIWCLYKLTTWQYFLLWDDISTIQDDFSLSYIRNQKIWFIFQQFFLLPNLTVLENVLFPVIYSDIPKSDKMKFALNLLEKLWLKDRLHYKPSALSGGQKQRTAIARSLINNPDIILADEPTWALDSKTWEEVMKLLQSLKSQWKTIIMVTHNKENATYSDRIVYLKDWKIV